MKKGEGLSGEKKGIGEERLSEGVTFKWVQMRRYDTGVPHNGDRMGGRGMGWVQVGRWV